MPPVRRRPLLCIATAVCASLVLAPTPAKAENADTAAQRAQAASQHVRDIAGRLDVAEAAYADALSQVGQQVSDYLTVDDERAAADLAAQQAADRNAASARALYRSGGQIGLFNTVLSSGSVSDLVTRMSSVQRVLAAAGDTADDAAERARFAQQVATSAQAQLDASIVTAGLIEQRAAAVDALLREAQEELDSLSARARALEVAEAAAAALAAARARAQATAVTALGEVRAQPPPAEFFRLYRAAAATCRGMDWTLLAAVGQVESGHGRNTAVSSAGAIGPMQFMPATFAAYAVDGDRDGRADPYSAADAIFTAARYLCAGGAGSPNGVRAALFRYNHAQWYVDLVLTVQARLRGGL